MFIRLSGARVEPILQGTHAECALACAAMILNFRGIRTGLSEIRKRYPSSVRGMTLRQLIGMFDDFRLSSRPLRVELQDLESLQVPSILHWDFEHFVVLERCNSRHAHIIDPKIGRRRLPLRTVSNHFTGIALEVTAGTVPAAPVQPPKYSLLNLLSGAGANVRNVFISLIFLTLAVNVLGLALPFLLKLIFDRVVPQQDGQLLGVALVAFLGVAGAQFLIELVRSRGLASFRRGLSEHLSNTIFTSLIWSKAAFFEERGTGTITTQYRSINAITRTVSEVLIARIIDSLAVMVGVVIAFVFAWKVGLVICGTIVAYGAIFALMQQELRSRLCQAIHAEAKENDFFVETIGAIQTVKLYSKELLKIGSWRNVREAVEGSLSNFGIYRASMYSALDLVTNLSWVLMVFILALDLLNGAVTIGTLTALVSWSTFIVHKCRDIAQAASELEVLEEHVTRVEDVISADKEEGLHSTAVSDPQYDLSRQPLRLSGISFRYDLSSPWLLENCDFRLDPGKMSVVRGPSGVGKTTLLKLILGLATPTSGTILVGERALSGHELTSIRRHCATVMQNDGVFMGSVRDNISFFDVSPDDELIERCARLACIAETIEQLPMRYDSLIGRNGAGFSAGQVQRIVLARALYRKPELLILDEFTSNLDQETEARILTNLKQMEITILTVAHRQHVIGSADHLFELRAGRIIPAARS